jgi:PTH1 family peptidyl-tRNA hydrolase
VEHVVADPGYLIVGLGNPGTRYELTRHNVGFLAVDYFADEHGLSLAAEKWQAVYGRDLFAGSRVLLVKPQTFMNKSGEAVVRFANFYRIPVERILVIHDDLDLEVGRVKVVARGGAGGHNGIKSIISHLGTSDFARLKIGIGRPERNDRGQGIPVDRYVLSAMNNADLAAFNELLPKVEQAIDLFVSRDVDACMNQTNRC